MSNSVDIKGIKVNYIRSRKTSGSKRILIFLHGWAGSSQSWEVNIKDLSQEYDCIAIDIPGFGVSEEPAEIWGIDEYSQFLHDFTKTLQISKFVLVGKSFGGRIAISYAHKWPETLSNLILVSPAGIEKKGITTQVIIALARVGKSLLSFLGLGNLERLRNGFYKVAKVNRDPGNYKWQVKKLVTNDNLATTAKRIKPPTLIVWGRKDNILPLKLGKELAGMIKGATFREIEGGHNAHQESYREFNFLVEEYLSS